MRQSSVPRPWSLQLRGEHRLELSGAYAPGFVELLARVHDSSDSPQRRQVPGHHGLLARLRLWVGSELHVEFLRWPSSSIDVADAVRTPYSGVWALMPWRSWSSWPPRPVAPKRHYPAKPFGCFLHAVDSFAGVGPIQEPLLQRVTTASKFAIASLDAGVRRVALRFAPEDRLGVYGLIAGDPSGRIAQLAQTCPGLLAYIVGADRDVRNLLLGSVRRGVPLKQLFEELCDWLRLDRHFHAPGLESLDARWTVRPWLMRAKAGVAADTLTSLPMDRVTVDDIPKGRQANLRWYRTMGTLLELQLFQQAPADKRKSTFAFFSKLAGTPLGDRLTDDVVREILDSCIATRCWPSRKSSAERFLLRGQEWTRSIKTAERLGRRRGARTVPLPCLGPRPPKGRVLRVEPIATAQELYSEGQEMRHCVYDYLAGALRATTAFYRVQYRGQRLTLSLELVNFTWRLGYLQAARNGPPSPSALRAIRNWLTRRGVSYRPGTISDFDMEAIPF